MSQREPHIIQVGDGGTKGLWYAATILMLTALTVLSMAGVIHRPEPGSQHQQSPVVQPHTP